MVISFRGSRLMVFFKKETSNSSKLSHGFPWGLHNSQRQHRRARGRWGAEWGQILWSLPRGPSGSETHESRSTYLTVLALACSSLPLSLTLRTLVLNNITKGPAIRAHICYCSRITVPTLPLEDGHQMQSRPLAGPEGDC